jgi:hypothetical protein
MISIVSMFNLRHNTMLIIFILFITVACIQMDIMYKPIIKSSYAKQKSPCNFSSLQLQLQHYSSIRCKKCYKMFLSGYRVSLH